MGFRVVFFQLGVLGRVLGSGSTEVGGSMLRDGIHFRVYRV